MLGEQMKRFTEYMNDSRAPRNEEEKSETEALAKLFDDIGLEGDDLIRERARKHPTFLLRCHWENHPELAGLQRFPELSGKILDFGCGSGHLTVLAAESGKDIDGLDDLLSAVLVSSLVASRSLTVRPKFYKADVRVGTGIKSFNAVWASHVFEHIQDPGPVFEGLKKRWMKNEQGLILISVPLGQAYPDPTHVHHWDDLQSFQTFFSPWLKPIRGETDLDSGCLRGLFQFK